MSITFNLISSGVLTPGVQVEFDSSNAQQGPALRRHVALLVGQRLSTGTKAAGSIDVITSESQARQFYGPGSMLAAMCATFLAENKVNQLKAIALDDDAGGVAATGSVDIGGTSIKAGTFGLRIANRLYRVAVSEGDTPTEIAAAMVAKVASDDDRQVDAAVNGGDDTIIDLTYRHKGLVGNEIDVRLDGGNELPLNMTAAITGLASGTTNPSVSSVITAMGETVFNDIAVPYTDTTNLDLMKTELVDRWGPSRQNDGQLYTAKRDSHANMLTFLNARNNEHESPVDLIGPSGPHEYAANMAAAAARELQNDPARPLQTVQLRGVGAPLDSEVRTQAEAQQVLAAGGTTLRASAGNVFIERVRTTRKTNAQGAPDASLADLNPKATLSYLRYDFRTRFTLKFSRYKLADDGVRFGPGQLVMTPKTAKAELVAIFTDWEELGLVENVAQFERDLIVQRSTTDRNRLDIRLPPDLINQLRVTAAQIQFIL